MFPHMPELPEVETIRTQLADRLVGRRIVGVDVRLKKIFFGDTKDIIGAKITVVLRRAKILILKLDNGKNIVVHLKMTGQLIYGEAKSGEFTADTISFSQGIPFAGFSLPGKTTHVVFDLDHGDKLFFNDMRQFGWVKVVDTDELAKIDEKHGPEPFQTAFTAKYLREVCQKSGKPIKVLLMDQEKIAGIGNIYANEALWCAKINPLKKAKDLAKEEQGKIAKLRDCILEVLERGLKYGGSSAADEAFVNVLGEKGKMQEHFNVYQKNKKPCPRCGETIAMTRVGGRGTFYCPKCQV